MKFDKPANTNYAATVIRVPALVDLPGLDNLIGIPVLGHQALTQKDVAVGDLRVAFTAESQLSEEYACENDLHRDPELNKTGETGYLEHNRRIRALKLRGNVSNALLMPLDSLSYTGINPDDLQEGDTFDTLNGHPICKKYEIPVKHPRGSVASKIDKAFKRVDKKLFPEHLDTDAYWRSKHLLKAGRECVITQKLHGTSWRGGHVPVAKQLSLWQRFLKRLGAQIPEYEWDVVFGSRKVVKDPKSMTQNHFYSMDLWTEYGKKIADLIPEGFIVYGELIGFTPDGTPLQKSYTYDAKPNEAELYAYRVAHINRQGHLSDLSWDGVKEFCQARGLKWTPELTRLAIDDPEIFLFEGAPTDGIDEFLDKYLDERFADFGDWNELPLVVSSHKTVDEGVCIRQEGLVPLILKAKSPKFLEHETKLLDKGDIDLESVA